MAGDEAPQRPAVVITGSTRGIGLAMAHAFRARGLPVMVSGRTGRGVAGALARLDTAGAAGQVCDVTDPDAVQALWDAARTRFGAVGTWVNNAGVTARDAPLWQLRPTEFRQVVDTNLLGIMHGCHVALRGMLEQGFGQVWNMEGLGSDGRAWRGAGPYCASKAGLTSVTRTLVKEAGSAPVGVGLLQPGIVATDLLTDEAVERNRRFLTAVAERPEVVGPWLVERMLRRPRNGATIRYLTGPGLALRLLRAPFSRRDPFSDRAPSDPPGRLP